MNSSKKLMKKIFLFILNSILIICNILCLYGYVIAIFKKQFEMIIISLPILPIFLIIAVIFYFLKNYLNISKLNRNLPWLAIVIYLVITLIDEAIVKTLRVTGNISTNIAISIPTYPAKVIIMILGLILLLGTVISTFKNLLKN